MGKPPRDRASIASRTYFVTAKTWGGRSLFQVERNARLFLETLFHYRVQGKYELHEFVLMPNHFHILFTTADDITVDRATQLLKGSFSHRAGQEIAPRLEIWQRGYVDHIVRDPNDYAWHREYIRHNPVRARLTNRPEEYPYSSAHPGYQLDPPPVGFCRPGRAQL